MSDPPPNIVEPERDTASISDSDWRSLFALPAGARITHQPSSTEELKEEHDDTISHGPAWLRYHPKPLPGAIPLFEFINPTLNNPSNAAGTPTRAQSRQLRQSGAPPSAANTITKKPRRKQRIRSNVFAPDVLPATDMPQLSKKRTRTADPLEVTHHGAPAAVEGSMYKEDDICVRRRRMQSSHIGEVSALLSFANINKDGAL